MKTRSLLSGLPMMLAVVMPCSCAAACAPWVPFCESAKMLADPNRAIFVGKVTSVTTPVVPATSAVKLSGPNIYPVHAVTPYPVANFSVQESFGRSRPAEFTVHLTSDLFDGSTPKGTVPFRQGEIWLVEAYFDATEQKWMTSHCQRTKPLAQAADDVRSLRAGAAGDRLTRSIQGQVENRESGRTLSDVQVELRGRLGTLSTKTDSHGQFIFKDLGPDTYEASAKGAETRKVDLSSVLCSYVALFQQ